MLISIVSSSSNCEVRWAGIPVSGNQFPHGLHRRYLVVTVKAGCYLTYVFFHAATALISRLVVKRKTVKTENASMLISLDGNQGR